MQEVPIGPDILVRAILARQPAGAYQRRVVKLAYLAEVAYAAENGQRLSTAVYIRDHFGPFSPDLVQAALSLPASQVGCETDASPVDPEVEAMKFIPTADCRPPLSPEQDQFLDMFMRSHGWERTQDLVDEARRTSLYLEAAFKEPLDFDRWLRRIAVAQSEPTFVAQVEQAARGNPGHTFGSILDVRQHLRSLRSANVASSS
ncbi:MAG: hypothetical protein WB786_03495 [Thermoplasmata archaeon]